MPVKNAKLDFRNLVNWGKTVVLTGTAIGALAVCMMFSACEQQPLMAPEIPEPPIVVADTLKFNISSAENFVAQLSAINTAANQPNTWVEINVAQIGIASEHIDIFGTYADNWSAKPNIRLDWTSIFPNIENILLKYGQWEKMQSPPLAPNPQNQIKFTVPADEVEMFEEAGQGDAVTEQAPPEKTLEYNIGSVVNFEQKFPEIIARADTLSNYVIVNMADMPFTAAQRDSLAARIGRLRGKSNVDVNSAGYYAGHEEIQFGFDNHYIPMGMPPLSAKPYKLIVTADDLPRFVDAGAGDAVMEKEIQPPEIRDILFNISSAQNFIQSFAAIADSFAVPYTRIIVNVAPISVASGQLAPLTDGVAGMNAAVNLNWANIYPDAAGILFSYAGNWVRLRNPNLAANSHNQSKWLVTPADYALFPSAQQGALEVQTRVVTFPAVNSASELIGQFSAIADSADVQYVSQVIVPIGSIDINRGQLPDIVSGVAGLTSPKIQLNWADLGIWPTESGILLRYNEDWVPLGKPDRPNLRANPHKWTVGEQDLPLFDAAGQGNAVEIEEEDPPPSFNKVYYGIDGSNLPYHSTEIDTVVWNMHGANAANLARVANWGRTVVVAVQDSLGLPGGRKAMGNVTNNVLALMQTPSTNKQADEYVLLFHVDPIITTYAMSPGAPGIGATAPMSISTIGDSTGTDQSWQMLRASNRRVQASGSYQTAYPQVQAATGTQIRLIPILDPEYRRSTNGVPCQTYFDVRNSNVTYAKVPRDLYVNENGTDVVIYGSDIHVIFTNAQIPATQQQIQTRIRNFLNMETNLNMVIGYTTSAEPGRRIR
ncbi:MAG: hypothetical protein FWG39_03685 [Alphaproteobacteria bacterium]|nr:hypothetical protein [Alphaproteobacteria bacterium]